jgi:hypothetical protein
MMPDPLFDQRLLVGLVGLCLMRHGVWPSDRATAGPTTPRPAKAPPQRSSDLQPFPGLTRTPPCAACEQAHADAPQPPGCPPPRIVPTRGRPRQVDTSQPCCPYPDCASRGGVGLGHLGAHGHPSGGPWRQRHCLSGGGSCQATQGTPWHGTRVAPEQLVWAVGARAAGLGIRAVARVFEVDPHTVLAWWGAVAEQAAAFSPSFWHDVQVTQGPRDELFAWLSAVKPGEVSEAEALTRLARSPPGVWAAIAPGTKLLLPLDGGDRTLAMAPGVGHQVGQGLAPGGGPLCLSAGCKESTTALLPPDGPWVQPERRQATGPAPPPRGMPLPGRRSAQGLKTVRQRRLVRVRHRVVFGPLEAVHQVLAACGWQLTTAFMARLHLSIRPPGAAVGRRVTPRCQGEDGFHQQLAV